MKAKTAAAIQKHPYNPKLDNDRTTASDIQQTDGVLIPICQFHIRQIWLRMTSVKSCSYTNDTLQIHIS